MIPKEMIGTRWDFPTNLGMLCDGMNSVASRQGMYNHFSSTGEILIEGPFVINIEALTNATNPGFGGLSI